MPLNVKLVVEMPKNIFTFRCQLISVQCTFTAQKQCNAWLDKPARLTIVPDCVTICQIRYKKQIVRRWHCLSCCYCCRGVACVVYHFIGPRVDHIAFCVAGLKVMMVMGMVAVNMISFVFLPITGSSRSSTQPYGKRGRMEETTIFLWERLRLQWDIIIIVLITIIIIIIITIMSSWNRRSVFFESTLGQVEGDRLGRNLQGLTVSIDDVLKISFDGQDYRDKRKIR